MVEEGLGERNRRVCRHSQVLDLSLGSLDLSAEESVLRLESLKSKDEIGELQPRRRELEMHGRFGLETGGRIARAIERSFNRSLRRSWSFREE